ncbi:SDR family oxidoreductase [Paenibacillus alkalitolerans]|uniref:SDR family oxidoreductase n=1 Tax=Paenibacillus alkalitolerans TaxID=2799335 RepID=UPI0018F35888|nr:SDR family oxidoreductase [Paenibacillus alkalitolerans]
MQKLEGKSAVVAAASGGLGLEVAKKLAEQGANVAICSRDPFRIEAAAREIERTTGRKAIAVAADVCRPAEIRSVVEAALSSFGGVDILINNAGGPPAGGFDDFDDGAWIAAHDLNLLSVVRFVRAVLPAMKEKRSGSIVNVISTSAKQPIPGLILSNTYRSAVVGLAKTLADELAPYNIRINNAAPGRIDTDRVRSLDEARARKLGITAQLAKQQSEAVIPLGRYGTPAEFANAVAFLASDDASYITGVTLQVDGGMVRTLT